MQIVILTWRFEIIKLMMSNLFTTRWRFWIFSNQTNCAWIKKSFPFTNSPFSLYLLLAFRLTNALFGCKPHKDSRFIGTICFRSRQNHWRIEGAPATRPRGSKFFHFHAVLAENLQINCLAYPLWELALLSTEYYIDGQLVTFEVYDFWLSSFDLFRETAIRPLHQMPVLW